MSVDQIKDQFNKTPSKAEVDSFCNSASAGNNVAVSEFLDKYPAAIDMKSGGWTALMYAANNNRLNTAGLLLERGADIDCPTPWNTTALIIAATIGGSECMVTFLLEKGADHEKRTNDQRTALEIIQEKFERAPIARLLRAWPEIRKKKLAAELDEITKTVMGGLKKPLSFKPFQWK